MRLMALVKSADHVCCRYRLAAFQSLLAQAGHDLELLPWPRSWWGRLRLQRQLKKADSVIVQRRLLAPWELPLVRRAARHMIFDFDDAIFLRNSYAPGGLFSATRQRGFTRMVGAADLIVAGNEFLGCSAAAEVGADRVRVVPTCIDPNRYPLARHVRSGRGVQLAWIGSSRTLRGLERTTALWDKIGRSCPGLGLRIICDKGLSLTRLPVELYPWSQATEATALADADIGISWLPDDCWSRGKCGLKILQYMAAGLPVVANPVGVQANLVRHCETGFLVETTEEWCDAIACLAADPALRRRMGREGRRVVETQYNLATGADLWIRALDEFAQSWNAPLLAAASASKMVTSSRAAESKPPTLHSPREEVAA
jgi:glycosyltransferase involved in cell wall biosynthesis